MRILPSNKPTACITMGYPAGIGPEVIAESLASPKVKRLANFLIIGDEPVFKKALRLTGARLNYQALRSEKEIDFSSNSLLFLDMANAGCGRFSFGKVSAACGKASISYIDKALSLIKTGRFNALITAPIHKHAAKLSGFGYPGHTEYLAGAADAGKYAMMLAAGPLRVILATTHIPIKDVSRRLNTKDIFNKLVLASYYLKHYYRIGYPRIAVCGLNPHAGEGGSIGKEEKEVIIPAIRLAKAKRLNVKGPLAADGVFYSMFKGAYDAVLCMYHDQGLVALKMFGRDRAVNITLGLPFIRTSPGHGTALDIAGKAGANPQSMKEAIIEAVKLSVARNV